MSRVESIDSFAIRRPGPEGMMVEMACRFGSTGKCGAHVKTRRFPTDGPGIGYGGLVSPAGATVETAVACGAFD